MKSYTLLILIALGVLGGMVAYSRTTPVPQDVTIEKTTEPDPTPEKEEPEIVQRPISPAATQKSTPTPSQIPPAPPPPQTSPALSPLSAPNPPPAPAPPREQESIDKPPLMVKSIGVNLDYYDPATGRAGDFVFTNAPLSLGLIFFDYAHVIPATMSAGGNAKVNPQPTFRLPMGTKIRSLVDGVVVSIPVLYSGDYSIHVAPNENSNWRYETEHVVNPIVKVGDRVNAGQVIAEVSPHDSQNNSGLGLVEIGILFGGQVPQHICPFAYLDDSIKEDIEKKITALYKAWEDYRGDSTLYNESSNPSPGCARVDPIEG